MTIYEIKRRTETTVPHFFSRKTLKFFHQTLKDFSVYKQKDGKFMIVAPIRQRTSLKTSFTSGPTFKIIGYTKRIFNPETNQIERVPNE